MRDPYQVLGVPSTASDDEVKKAYRDLARKYHPDNYQDNPLADLAQERMKEINEAYEEVQAQRKRGGASSSGSSGGYGSGGSSYGYQSGTYGYQNTGYGAASGRVRMAIQQGDLNLAEELLNAQRDHDAEWNFLKGVICNRRGWMDEARRYFQTAVQMAPDNPEYQHALDRMEGRSANRYNPYGGTLRTVDCMDGPCRYLTLAAMCSICSGGSICCI